MPPADRNCSFFDWNSTEQGAVHSAIPVGINRAFTIKNRPILGTIIAYGFVAASQLVTIPTMAIELRESEQAVDRRTVVLAGGSISRQAGERYPDVESQVRTYFQDIPVLAEVARCESRFVHADPATGAILTGHINPSDLGVMQINRTYHEATAKRLGVDIYTLDGNMEYARYLYSQYGTQPWRASSACWGS
ncbi:MAG: hypothetical protein KBD21_02790 [Candidatus Pacebacteria bacterium]|nr:hypothetical protein [Candidatus Paceibacterota bacterium]